MLRQAIPVAERRSTFRLLLIDPEAEESARIALHLRAEGEFRIQTAASVEQAALLLDSAPFDAALVDYGLWSEKSAELVGVVRDRHPDVAIVLLTNGENEREALPALRLGANDFLSRQHLHEGGQVSARVIAAIEESRALRRRDTMVRWLEREAKTDHLTGLHNRRAFDEKLAAVCAEAHRSGEPVTLVVLDVAGTRDVNEAYGHVAGDLMIRRTAAAINRCVRGADFAARIGGDDFGIIIPESGMDLALRIARRIAQELERENTECWDLTVPVAVTFGVATGTGCQPSELFGAADQQLSAHKSVRPLMYPFRMVEDNDDPSVA